jgi:hypothetical protein
MCCVGTNLVPLETRAFTVHENSAKLDDSARNNICVRGHDIRGAVVLDLVGERSETSPHRQVVLRAPALIGRDSERYHWLAIPYL